MPEQDLWFDAQLSPSGQPGVTVPFSQSFTIGTHNQWQVKPTWFGPAQSAINGELAVGAINKIIPANDLIDPLVVVVDDDSQLISDGPIISGHDKIPERCFCIETLGSIKIIYPFAD